MKNLHPQTQMTPAFNRRRFIKSAAAGLLGLQFGGLGALLPSPAGAASQDSPQGTGFVSDLDIDLRATPGEVSLFPGKPTDVWRYQAELVKGDPDRLIHMDGSYLGPVIRARQGEKVRIRFHNEIPQASIVHWHGLHVPADMDGHPRYAVAPGESYIYEFQVKNRAGTYWYHPHPHGRTGYQVYGGLAGLFLVSDDQEEAAGLPTGAFDIPLVIQDRTFDRDNQLAYISGHPMERMNGFLGDRVLVNGRPDFTLPVATCAYRLRMLNGSNSRIYRIAWGDGRPLAVIATDGGLLEKPVSRRFVFLAPGERMEIFADFSDRPVGSEAALVSLPLDSAMMGGVSMGRGMMMGGNRSRDPGVFPGPGFTMARIKVVDRVEKSLALPETLSRIPHWDPKDTVNPADPRRFRLSMGHMRWTINGRTFEMDGVARDEVVRLGSKEIWEFTNAGGGRGMMGGMNMAHPIHVHGKPFRVLERTGTALGGHVDEGLKDTVLLMPGERIRILVDFQDYPGLFLYHCHNLEHEDMGMMRNYRVVG